MHALCTCHHRHSIFCILPPHILVNVARNGSPGQRAAVLSTLANDQTFRSLRASLVGQPSQAIQRRGAASPDFPPPRTIYSAHNTETLPGSIVRSEQDGPTGDAAVDEAFDGLGRTLDFYWSNFERNSIDDEGLPLDATVHYGDKYDNAFWDGRRMIFGDGDGELFNRFTIAVDIIGHELTHGVTEDEGGLIYAYQSGALNESLSDVFGSLIKQSAPGKLQTADQADWLIGEGLLAPGVQGVALRSMKAPGTAYDDPVLGKDPQPAHMNDFMHTHQDNGGVHINSGIPNHAFYLAATAIGGYAWEKAGHIWYETLRDSRLRPTTGFIRFARLTVDVAGRLYGRSSNEKKAVADAWAAVGVIRVS